MISPSGLGLTLAVAPWLRELPSLEGPSPCRKEVPPRKPEEQQVSPGMNPAAFPQPDPSEDIHSGCGHPTLLPPLQGQLILPDKLEGKYHPQLISGSGSSSARRRELQE